MANTNNDSTIDKSSPVPKNTVYFLGFMHIFLALLTGYLVYALWPEVINPESKIWKSEGEVFFWEYNLGGERRILLLVFLAGAVGSFIHSATSFANYVGTKKLEKSWTWWYILRPFIGVSIAFLFYLVFRGGLLNGNTDIEDLNVFGILTISGLTGLFSDRATLKLKEIFDQVFKPDDNRGDTLEDEKSVGKGETDDDQKNNSSTVKEDVP